MKERTSFGILLILILSGSLMLVFNVQPVKAMNPPAIQWTKTYPGSGHDVAYSVVQTRDGGYVIAGDNSSSPYESWVKLVKTDSAGNQIWVKSYVASGAEATETPSIVQTSDAGYALAYIEIVGYHIIAYRGMKLDSTGSQIWNLSFGGSMTSLSNPCVIQTFDGGLVWAGSSHAYAAPYNNILLTKTDLLGNKLWNKAFGDYSYAYSVVQTSDGGFALAGSDSSKALLLRTDSSGNQLWNSTYSALSSFSSVVLTRDGGIALAGGNMLVKTDSLGNLQWSQTYTGLSAKSLVQTGEGGFALAGGNMLVKTDSLGNLQWTQTFGATVQCLVNTIDGGYAVAGSVTDTGSNYFWLAKIASPPLVLENGKTWYWASNTMISSTVKGDVDGDGQVEIVTGGFYNDGARNVAQLCVWNGGSLALENVKTWYWVSNTQINSVALGDVDGDGQVEIVTGGFYNDGTRNVAQLCVWNGGSLALENVKTWYWTSHTTIQSVALGNVDGDGQVEIVTGGYYNDGTHNVAQLCVWNGGSLALENVKTWYWVSNTQINSVALGDVDGDGQVEIVTGGEYYSVTDIAQLCVWNGGSLALENVRTWYWSDHTFIFSVALGDVDGDGQVEIVTGGYYNDGSQDTICAQLCVWNGGSLVLENVRTWCWLGQTSIKSVALGDVDDDGNVEIVTGGYYGSTPNVAQLCVWDGRTLASKNVKTWYWISHTSIQSVALGDVDGDGKIEMVTGGSYNDSTRYIAQLSVWSFWSWSIETVDAPVGGNVGIDCSLALDSAGNPHISYRDNTNTRLLFAYWTGTAWAIQLVDSTGNVGIYTSLALDSAGNPHISYLDVANSNLKYASWTGSAWNTQTVPSTKASGSGTSLALDSAGNPHISYYDSSTGYLKYASWTGSAWNIQTVGTVGYFSSLALDSADNPHISYYDTTNDDLKYASWTGSAWNTQTVVDGPVGEYIGWYTSLKLDSTNNPHIGYFDATNGDLKYASWTGSAWNIQTVDSAGNVGIFCSLALDSSNNPHISYHDTTNGDLKYASWTGSTWNTHTVDSTGDVGYYTSLALDSSNNPHISYYDTTNHNLKYASFS